MIMLELDGRRMSIHGWAQELGITDTSLRSRLARGWTIEKALSTACRGQRRPRAADAPMVARAKKVLQSSTAAFDSPWEALAANIVCQAIADWPDRMQRADVERFLRGRWFAALCGLDGEEIIRRLRAAA